jgi:hypothetical protein
MKIIYRKNVIKLLHEIRCLIQEKIDFSKYEEGNFLGDNLVEQTDLEVYCQGISNDFLSEVAHAIIGYEVEVIGEIEELFYCPCCGFRTLTELYDICPYCKWEDDGTSDIKVYSSINKRSIEDYRNNILNDSNKYYINKWYTK